MLLELLYCGSHSHMPYNPHTSYSVNLSCLTPHHQKHNCTCICPFSYKHIDATGDNSGHFDMYTGKLQVPKVTDTW